MIASEIVEVRIVNSFHGTATTAKAQLCRHGVYRLTPAQAGRIRRHLCGVDGCTCGGALGERGGESSGLDQVAAVATPSGSSCYSVDQREDGSVDLVQQ